MAFGITSSTLASPSLLPLSRTQTALTKAFAQLTSGMRITSAADDAAGLAIASGLAASITQISQASRNIGDTASALTIADGALGQVSGLTGRLEELATMAANGTYTDEQRGALQAEYSALTDEIQRIGETTSFNGKKLLDGSSMTAQIGPSGETLQIGGIDLSNLASSLSSQNIGTQSGAQAAMDVIHQFSQDLTSQRSGTIGAAFSQLESTQSNLETQRIAQSSALSQIEDADLSIAILDLTSAKMLQHYQVSLIQQSVMSQVPQRLSLWG